MRETTLKHAVAERFNAMAKARGIVSLERFAEEAGIGFCTIYRFHRGLIDIRLSTLEKIAQALQCSPADLLTDTTATPSPAMAGEAPTASSRNTRRMKRRGHFRALH